MEAPRDPARQVHPAANGQRPVAPIGRSPSQEDVPRTLWRHAAPATLAGCRPVVERRVVAEDWLLQSPNRETSLGTLPKGLFPSGAAVVRGDGPDLDLRDSTLASPLLGRGTLRIDRKST